MERRRVLASNVFATTLLLLISAAPVHAQMADGIRSFYNGRLANNAAGQYGGYAGAPLTGVNASPILESLVTWDRLRRDTYTPANGATFAILPISSLYKIVRRSMTLQAGNQHWLCNRCVCKCSHVYSPCNARSADASSWLKLDSFTMKQNMQSIILFILEIYSNAVIYP